MNFEGVYCEECVRKTIENAVENSSSKSDTKQRPNEESLENLIAAKETPCEYLVDYKRSDMRRILILI
jgi:hypothetical protein